MKILIIDVPNNKFSGEENNNTQQLHIYDPNTNVTFYPTADLNGNVLFVTKDGAVAKADSITLDEVIVNGILRGLVDKVVDFVSPYFLKGLEWYLGNPSYKDEQEPYNDIINIGNNVAGLKFRGEMMGMHKPDKYYPNYYYPNPNFKEENEIESALGSIGIKEEGTPSYSRKLFGCARNANLINLYYGKPTSGDAPQRHGIYGDSIISVNPNMNKNDYSEAVGLNLNMINKKNGDYVANDIDNHFLKNGDIVDIYFNGPNQRWGYETGDYNRANSHTGTIVRTGPKPSLVYVAHDHGTGVEFQPINELLGTGLFKNSYITGIRRPGTQKHPYKDSKGNITYNKRNNGGNLFYDGGSNLLTLNLPGIVVTRPYPSEQLIKLNIEKEWPSAAGLPQYRITKDPTFTRERTGAGSIEYFNEPSITYRNGTTVLNPNQEPTLLFDPNTNTVEDIKLDLLHHYRAYDKEYQKLLLDYTNALIGNKHTASDLFWNSELGEQYRNKYGKDIEKHLDEWNLMVEENINNDQYLTQAIDGSLRSLMASDALRLKSNYDTKEGAESSWLKDKYARQAYNNIIKYLKTPKK